MDLRASLRKTFTHSFQILSGFLQGIDKKTETLGILDHLFTVKLNEFLGRKW